MEKREVTSFINPRRDRTPLTKPVTKPVGESIYFLHSYLDFSLLPSAFAHSVNSHGVQDSLVALHMKIYRISVCSLEILSDDPCWVQTVWQAVIISLCLPILKQLLYLKAFEEIKSCIKVYLGWL